MQGLPGVAWDVALITLYDAVDNADESDDNELEMEAGTQLLEADAGGELDDELCAQVMADTVATEDAMRAIIAKVELRQLPT